MTGLSVAAAGVWVAFVTGVCVALEAGLWVGAFVAGIVVDGILAGVSIGVTVGVFSGVAAGVSLGSAAGVFSGVADGDGEALLAASKAYPSFSAETGSPFVQRDVLLRSKGFFHI